MLDSGATFLEQPALDRSSRPEQFPPRHSRRLSDKILIAFHHACDTGELEVAASLLRVLEDLVSRRHEPPEGNRRRNIESLVAAHERLWHLRHPDAA